MLIADLARLCGLRAAVAEGWKADLTRWTIEELSDITGHAWNYIYLQNTGWIAVKISFSGGKWNFTDTTFAAGGVTPAESGYTTLRVY